MSVDATIRLLLVEHPADALSRNLRERLILLFRPDEGVTLVDGPENADLIVFIDSYTDTRSRFVRRHPYLKSFLEKCFLLSLLDDPIHVLPGLYVSLTRRHYCPGWNDSFCYFESHHKNAFLAEARRDFDARRYFFTFMGRDSHPLRRKIFALSTRRDDVLIKDTSSYDHWDYGNEHLEEHQMSYALAGAASKFILCPRGAGVSSIRLFEAMELGCVPVILSDDWVPPAGPRWEEFSVRVAESDVGRIERILEEREPKWQAMAVLARAEWERWFQEKDFVREISRRLLQLRPADPVLRRQGRVACRRQLATRFWQETTYRTKRRVRSVLDYAWQAPSHPPQD